MRLSVQQCSSGGTTAAVAVFNLHSNSPQVRRYCCALSAYGLIKRDTMTSTDRQHHEKSAQWTVDTLAGEPSLVYRGRLNCCLR